MKDDIRDKIRRLLHEAEGAMREAYRLLDATEIPMLQEIPAEKPMLSIKEAAKYIGLSMATVYSEARYGRLQSVRVGSRVLIPRAALAGYIEEHKQAAIDRMKT